MNRKTRKQIIPLEKVREELQKYKTLPYYNRELLEIAALNQISSLKVLDPSKGGQLKTALHKMDKRKILNETDRSARIEAAPAKAAEYKNGLSYICQGFAAPDFECVVCGEML
jgi:hypothetical protein